ncbi:MAG: hypothetical protein L3K18_02665 [Thermoplasmata archaeon]|nr:hypothetical protein [Thermoplasmata archaeon]MCI4356034.1 hypothetical protein [Thermoplasmata archaeon]
MLFPRWLIAVGVLLVVLASGVAFSEHPGAPSSAPAHPASVTTAARGGVIDDLLLTDGTSGSFSLGAGQFANISDSTSSGEASAHGRSYWIVLDANSVFPGVNVRLVTNPVPNWAFPDQIPGGSDNLPTLSLWQWSVWRNGGNDTANWTENLQYGTLTRQTTVMPDLYQVVGTSEPILPVTVHANAPAPARPTEAGVFLQGPGLAGGLAVVTDPDYRSLAAPLGLDVVRVGIASIGTQASWNSATGVPRFNFTGFDAAAGLAGSLGAHLLVSLPAGSWGDGNILPGGMPLDQSLMVPFAGSTGYFPTNAALVSYLDAVLNHTTSSHEPVRYWNFGNEMPLVNATIVGRYIALFNLAAHTIHAYDPTALVGSDVMTNRTYAAEFAAQTQGVGYLSFHYYPAAGICVVNNSYCAPGTEPGTGTADASLFHATASISDLNFLPPSVAASDWFNATGNHVPVLVTESNLNGVGGSPGNAATGSDPRQQTLLGAAWLVSTLLNASAQNVSDFVYFTLTSALQQNATVTQPIGGWGFGLTSEGTSDNDTRYAPYWALSLWASATPAGATPLAVDTDATGVVGSLATGNASTVHVLLVNRAALPVTIPVSVAGRNMTVRSVEILDNRSYVETADPVTHVVELDRSSLATVPGPSNVVHLGGYGVALVTENASATNGTNQTGTNDSGNDTGSGDGNNTTANSTPPIGGTPGTSHPGGFAPKGGTKVVGTSDSLSPASGLGSTQHRVSLPDLIAGSGLGLLGAVGSVAVWRGTPDPPPVHRPSSLSTARRSAKVRARARAARR